MPSVIVWAAWIGWVILPVWYAQFSRWGRWGFWILFGICVIHWNRISGHVQWTPLALQVFVDLMTISALGWVITVVTLGRWSPATTTIRAASSVFWLTVALLGWLSLQPLFRTAHTIPAVAQRVEHIYRPIARQVVHVLASAGNQATFGSVWIHVLGVLGLALLFTLPSWIRHRVRWDAAGRSPGISHGLALWFLDAIPQSGLPRAGVSLLLPLLWSGFYHADLMTVQWPVWGLIWIPVLSATIRSVLLVSQSYPEIRVILTGLLVAVSWHPALTVAMHTTSPAFPPSATGVLWANHWVQRMDPPPPTQAPWLVNQSAAQTRIPQAIAVTAHTSLVPGSFTHLPSSWHPQRLTETLANQTLNNLVASTLSTTSVWALVIALIVLFIALGSLPTMGLAVGMGAVTSMATLAILRWIATWMSLSPYALNIANLLAMGLALDYAIFQIQAFGRVWHGRPDLDRTERLRQARQQAIDHAQKAVPWSVLALSLTVLAFPVALPGGLGWSFALASMTAAVTALILSQFLVIPVLTAWPDWWWRGRLPMSLSDGLDRVYQVIGRGNILVPGLIFLATFAGLLVIDRHPPQITLLTPSTAAQLLPSTNIIREAFAARLTPPPSSSAMLVLHVPPDTAWTSVQSHLTTPPDPTLVHWTDPLATISPTMLQTMASDPHGIPAALRRMWNPARGILLIPVQTLHHAPVPRTLLGHALHHSWPPTWQWAFTGASHAVQRTASTWFRQGLLLLVGTGLLVSAGIRWRLTQSLRMALLAMLFELIPLMTTLTVYPLIARHWPHMFPTQIAFPVILLAVSLMLALALDYQVLLTHAMGAHPSPERIAEAVAQTGGSITSAGLVMASSFYVLLMSPLPFLRAAGMLIGTNVLLDTFLMRSFLMPSTAAAFGDTSSASSSPWYRSWDRHIAGFALLWALLTIPVLIHTDLPHVRIVPAPTPLHLVLTPRTLWHLVSP